MSKCMECGVRLNTEDIPVLLCPRHFYSYFVNEVTKEVTSETTKQEEFVTVPLPQGNNTVRVLIPNGRCCDILLTGSTFGIIVEDMLDFTQSAVIRWEPRYVYVA